MHEERYSTRNIMQLRVLSVDDVVVNCLGTVPWMHTKLSNDVAWRPWAYCELFYLGTVLSMRTKLSNKVAWRPWAYCQLFYWN